MSSWRLVGDSSASDSLFERKVPSSGILQNGFPYSSWDTSHRFTPCRECPQLHVASRISLPRTARLSLSTSCFQNPAITKLKHGEIAAEPICQSSLETKTSHLSKGPSCKRSL